MPRDLTAYADRIETKPDLSKLSLEALAYILRHKEEWPYSFSWEFQWTLFCFERGGEILNAENPRHSCRTAGCALGLGKLKWGYVAGVDEGLATFASRIFGISGRVAAEIFLAGAGEPGITEEVVAGRIDDHLAARTIRYLVEGGRG